MSQFWVGNWLTLGVRTTQPLFLLRAAMKVENQGDEALRHWLDTEVTGPFEKTLRRTIDYYLDDQPAVEGHL